MAKKGFLEVGRTNDTHEVVVNHPEMDVDANGVGHIVFSQAEARDFAYLLIKQAAWAEAEANGDEFAEHRPHETSLKSQVLELAKRIEMHCPCGARPESDGFGNVYPHVGGCPVEQLMGLLSMPDPTDRKAAPPIGWSVAWPVRVEDFRKQHNGVFGIELFFGHDGHNVCRFKSYYHKLAEGESGRSMQEAVERCVEVFTKWRESMNKTVNVEELSKQRMVPGVVQPTLPVRAMSEEEAAQFFNSDIVEFVRQAQYVCELPTGPQPSDIDRLRKLGKKAFPLGYTGNPGDRP